MSDMPERIWVDDDGNYWSDDTHLQADTEYIHMDTHNRLEAQYEAAMGESKAFVARINKLKAALTGLDSYLNRSTGTRIMQDDLQHRIIKSALRR